MAEKQLKSIKFAGLGDTYVLPEIDDSLSTSGMAADAKATGDALALKAPSGYGLGVSEPVIITDCNLAVKSGWYKTTDTTLNSPLARGCWMRVDAYNDKWTHQVWFNDTDGGGEVHRYQQNGIWTEWEWENPPYQFNKVYRTTERYRGYPVYAFLLSTGGFASGYLNFTTAKGFTDDPDYVAGGWTVISYDRTVIHDGFYGAGMMESTGDYSLDKYVENIRGDFTDSGLSVTLTLKSNSNSIGSEAYMNLVVKFVKQHV